MVKAFLVDLDGTLIENESLKARAFAEACHNLGGEIDPLLYTNVIGTSLRVAFNFFTDQANITPTYETFSREYSRIYQDLLNGGLALTSGAIDFINFAVNTGIRLAVVSSESKSTVERILFKLDLFHYFDLLVTNELVTHHKPDPEPYLFALSHFGFPAHTVVAFEDSISGLQAASTAGCKCIAVSHQYNVSQDLSLAEMTVSSFSEYLAALQAPALQH